MNKILKGVVIIFSFFVNASSLLASSITIQDIEVGFSPGQAAHKIILLAIEEAKESIDIAAYSFTSKSIALAIVNAKDRGVKIRVVTDKKSNTGKYTAVTYLANHYVQVRLNDKYAIMHNKFMIVDGHSVETGSFNYTQSAAYRNAENVIYLRNNLNIAEKYKKEFNRLWGESINLKPTY